MIIAAPSAPAPPTPPPGPKPRVLRPGAALARSSPLSSSSVPVTSPPCTSWEASLRAREQVHQASAPAPANTIRMDDEEDREQSRACAAAVNARASSLARGYQALGGAEFHCLDSDAEDETPTSRVEVPPTPRTRRRLEAALMFSSAEPSPAEPAQQKKRSASVAGSVVANAVASWESRAAPDVPVGSRHRPHSAGAVRSEVLIVGQHTFSPKSAKVKNLEGLLKSEARLAEFSLLPNLRKQALASPRGSQRPLF